MVLGEPPTGGQVVAFWRSSDERFPTSRERIRNVRDVQAKEPWTLPEQGNTTLPQRLMAITLSNSFASQYGVPELTRYGRPVASDKADEIETVMKATLERLLSPRDLFGVATQAGEWGIAVLPADADWSHVPQYTPDGYSLDAEGRDKDDAGYTERDPRASRKQFDRDHEDYLANLEYVVVDLLDPTDCAPILVQGRHGRRYEARGIAVRRLFARETLLGMGYRCECLKSENATLIPRGDRPSARGKGGQLYLYTCYLTLWDEDAEELVPCIVYSVGGQTTDRVVPATGEAEPAVINLKERYGITTPQWGYYFGLHTDDPDPDRVGIPFLDAYAGLVTALEDMLNAGVHHAKRSSYRGSWVEPGENVPPEAYTETVENSLRLKTFDAPKSGELVTAPGRVTPDAPPPLGPAATQMMAAVLEQLQINAPDPAQPAGTGASGHAMSLASGLIEAAHGDIPKGVLDCYQDVACWVLECLCAVMRTYSVPYVLDANEELPPEPVGRGRPTGRRYVTQRYVLTEKDIGKSYKITATWRQKPDPVNVTLAMDRATRGFGSIADVLEAAGETNTTWKIAEVLYYRQVMTPGTPENIELSAYVSRRRGDVERAQQLDLQAKQMLEPQGTPTAAIAPEAQQMADMAGAAAGGNPPMGPSGVQTGTRSSIAATVQGAQQGGPTTQDALVAGQMGIQAAQPAPIGGPGGAGVPV